MMNRKSDIARTQCERTAREYYAYRKKRGTANDLVEIPAMRKLIGDVRGRKIIDCGCGFGTHSIWCAERGALVTGVDISETMIRLAKEEAVRAGVIIDFRVGDVTDLRDMKPATFDLAISTNAVCFDVPRFFRQVARVLKPGGAFCLCEVHPLMNTKYGDYLDRGLRRAKNVFGKLRPFDPDYEWQWEHLTLEDYITAFRMAGFLIDLLLEPGPDPAMRSANPQLYERACKQPIFVLIRAVKG